MNKAVDWEEISEICLEAKVEAKVAIKDDCADVTMWVEVVDGVNRHAIAYVSLTDSIKDALNDLTLMSGRALVTESEKGCWLTAADILEIEAKRIRSVMQSSHVKDESITLQVVNG